MATAAAKAEVKAERDKGFPYRPIFLIFSAHTVHDIYAAFIAPLLPLLIDKLGLSLVLAGSLAVFTQIPSLFSPFIGYLADRFTVRYLVIFAPAVTGTLATLIGFMPSYGAATILLFAAGVSMMCFHAPAPAMIAQISGNKVGRGMSMFMAGGELGRALGPLLAGFGLAQWGIEGLWRMMFFGWLASFVLFVRLRDVSAKSGPRKSQGKPRVKQFARVFAPLFGVMMLRNISVTGLNIFMVVYLVDVRDFDLTLAVAALSLYQLAGVGGALSGGTLSDRFGRRPTVAAAALIACPLMILFTQTDGILMFPVLIALGLTALSVTPVLQAMVQDQLPENRATASGVFMLYAFGVRALGTLIAGALGDAIGLQSAFILIALISLLSIPFVFALPATPAARHEDL